MLTRSVGAATLWCLVPVSFAGALQAAQQAEAQRSATLHFGDVDGDGLDDALVVGSAGEVSLLANRGEGRFEDVTAASGLERIEFASCALFADFDGDGRVDLFVGSSEQRLWRNDGKGLFTALPSGLEHDLVDLEAHALDHDRDGRLDLVLHTEAGDLFYRNAPTGRFERVELPESDHPARATSSGANSDEDADTGSNDAAGVSAARKRHRRWLQLRASNASSNSNTSNGSNTSNLASSPTLSATSTGPLGLAGSPTLICAGTLVDQATTNCIEASSIGVLGSLYPLSSTFFVDSANSRVGVGTTAPLYTLHVSGKLVSGVNTSANGLNATVGGGSSSTASGAHATIAGGESNTAGHSHAFIGGGLSNTTLGTRAVIGGGISNRAGNSSVVGGGSNNEANLNFSTVAGGRLNVSNATYSAIGGGASNSATGQYSFVGGGGEDNAPASGNVASGLASAITGGRANAASGDRAAIGGGSSNQATSQHTAISGGRANSAFGAFGAIPGGELNTAAGSHSLAAGRRAKALHDGSFVWGDSTDLDFSSSAPNQFLIRAAGGVGIGTTNPSAGLHVQSDEGMALVGTIDVGTIPIEGPGTRMTWHPSKAAFRAGRATLAEWDDVRVGRYSTALGLASIASGELSFAAGGATEASGRASIAMGEGADALADHSVAIGLGSSASGNGSLALRGGSATGASSFALGSSTASGSNSIAIGSSSVASHSFSTAIGTAQALGFASSAIGSDARATAYKSTAVGSANLGGGDPLNWVATDPVFEVGNGTSFSSRSNALTVLKNGKVGIGTTTPTYRLSVIDGAAASLGAQVQADAIGLQSTSSASSGFGIGVWGIASSPTGHAAYFTGPAGSANFFEHKVGIGTDTPALQLHVVGGSDVTPAGGGFAQFGASTGQNIAIDGNEIMARNNGVAASLSLNAEGGPVRIGRTGQGQISISDDLVSSDDGLTLSSFDSMTFDCGQTLTIDAGNSLQIDCGNSIAISSGSDIVTINSNVGIQTAASASHALIVNGTAAKPGGGSWAVSSDARLKKNVEALDGALESLLALRGVTYEYLDPKSIGEPEGERVGFIAQEVERVFPDWVGEHASGMKYVSIRGFEALTVEALRELRAEHGRALAERDARLAELAAQRTAQELELAAVRAELAALRDAVRALAGERGAAAQR